MACAMNNTELVEILITAGADPNLKVFETSPLEKALENKNADIIKILLQAGLNINVSQIIHLKIFSYYILFNLDKFSSSCVSLIFGLYIFVTRSSNAFEPIVNLHLF